MAIASNNYQAGTAVSFATSATLSYTISAGSNLVLVAAAHIDLGGTEISPDSATWGADAMTLIGTARLDNEALAQLWYLLNPAVATRTITISSTGTNFRRMRVSAAYLTGAAQEAPEASGSDALSTGNTSITLNTLTNGGLILSAAALEFNGGLTPNGTGHVEKLDLGSSSLRTWRGELPVTGSSHTFGTDQTSTAGHSTFGAAFKAAGGTPATFPAAIMTGL